MSSIIDNSKDGKNSDRVPNPVRVKLGTAAIACLIGSYPCFKPCQSWFGVVIGARVNK